MSIFKPKRPLTPFGQAVKRGVLLDMKVKPYAEFNRFLSITCPMWMTRAAFKDFIRIPREKGFSRVKKDLRWAMVISAFRRLPQEGDPTELVYDVPILCLSGFQRFMPIKLVSVDTERDEGLLFLLPGEEPPISVSHQPDEEVPTVE